MGSLNDYGRRVADATEQRGGWRRRLLRQCVAAVALFLLVAGLVQAEGPLGDGARFVAGQGIEVSSSWVDFGGAQAVEAPSTANVTVDEQAGANNDLSGTDSNAAANTQISAPVTNNVDTPQFTAPASGIVVTELAVTVGGFSTEKGVLIQGSTGQTVKAAAAGSVRYLGESEAGYLIELTHSGGFVSRYQGLSTVEVTAGQELALGEALGETASGEVTFSLLRDNAEVDPLEYLFN